MGRQHPRPASAPRAFESRHDPRDRLEQLHADRREAKAELREVLERLAERHGISQKDINYAIDGYTPTTCSPTSSIRSSGISSTKAKREARPERWLPAYGPASAAGWPGQGAKTDQIDQFNRQPPT